MCLPFFTPSARRDLIEIFEYISRDKPGAASRLVDRLESKCVSLATNPDVGFRRDELAVGLRVWPVESWLIFYRLVDSDIEIVRVVHGARDLPHLFE
ncbi:MAG: type II toxin-antitoxin system RelE/ParE family toxin [Planctomycetaceae bacterium]|nr:type II toxin-antitoxin system RelE/ParE family toxin [Planctomycetaceae bacterium]